MTHQPNDIRLAVSTSYARAVEQNPKTGSSCCSDGHSCSRPYGAHGHYINMTDPAFTKVACGRYTNPNGDVWTVQNFSR